MSHQAKLQRKENILIEGYLVSYLMKHEEASEKNNNSKLFFDKKDLDKLFSILHNKAKKNIDNRVSSAEKMAKDNFEEYGLTKKGDVSNSEIICEVLTCSYFRKGPKNNIDLIKLRDQVDDLMKNKKTIYLIAALFPDKVPCCLKSNGEMLDLAEIQSLFKIYELCKIVEFFYKKEVQGLKKYVKFTIINDGSKFFRSLGLNKKRVYNYIDDFRLFIKYLKFDRFIECVDYKQNLKNNLSIFKRIYLFWNVLYEERFLYKKFNPHFSSQNVNTSLHKIKNIDDIYSEHFVSLYKSMLFCKEYNFLHKYNKEENKELYKKLMFNIVSNKKFKNEKLNELMIKIIEVNYKTSIRYLAKIISVRDYDYDLISLGKYKNAIRYSIHSKPGHIGLALNSGIEKTQPWHGTGYIYFSKERIKMKAALKIELENLSSIPVYINKPIAKNNKIFSFLGRFNKLEEPFFYIDKKFENMDVSSVLKLIEEKY